MSAPLVALLIGAALGLAFLIRVPRAAQAGAAEPLGDFARILFPLVLPILVVVLVGTTAYSWWVPLLAVPALVVAAWYLIAAPEWPNAIQALRNTRGWLRHASWRARVGQAVLLAVVIAAAAYSWHEVTPTLNSFDDRPTGSSTLIEVTVIFWVTAVWLRLLGFATSWLRAPATAVVIAGFFLLLMAAGLLPFYDSVVDTSDGQDPLEWIQEPGHLVILLALALALPMVVGALARGRTRFQAPLSELPTSGAFRRGPADTLRGVGFFACVFAAIFLAGAAVLSMLDYQSEATESVTAGKVIEADDVEHATLPPNPHRLALDYMPVLAFTNDEQWTPVNVKSYINDPNCPAELVSLYGGGEKQQANQTADDRDERCQGRHVDQDALLGTPIKNGKLPTACPGLRVPCFQITIRCPDGADYCARPSRVSERDGQIQGPEKPAVYVRTITRDEPRDSPSAFSGFGPFANLSTLVQYWYFYRYDEWTRPVLGGHLVQRHEGDWEAVTVGFSPKEPLFVGYSAHCGGTWREWDSVELAKTPAVVGAAEQGGSDTVEHPRPLIAVAEGSHANYVKTDDRRAPDWAGCAGVPVGTTTLLSYASNIRDETEDGWEWRPGAGQAHFVDGECRRRPSCGSPQAPDLGFPMNFPGTWGANDFTELVNERSQHLGGEHSGPKTPPLQPLWYEPTKTIFCSKNWDKPSGFDQPLNCNGRKERPPG
jgi:hypothetical protein